jgi:hypothetical protein
MWPFRKARDRETRDGSQDDSGHEAASGSEHAVDLVEDLPKLGPCLRQSPQRRNQVIPLRQELVVRLDEPDDILVVEGRHRRRATPPLELRPLSVPATAGWCEQPVDYPQLTCWKSRTGVPSGVTVR